MKFYPDLPPRHKDLRKKRLGKIGEDFACDYLLKHHYRILDRNFQKRYGELDIVALDGGVLVFVEVKTRIGRKFGLPEESVTPRKLHEVKQTALYYKLLHPELSKDLRIDVIGIELAPDETLKYFNHIQNVTL
ncbi:YraN family protein [Candidatus Gottesmanbacteria bacterium]|nr:YraN family protein [Candidatus Gottesmanbacteria bacterium]